MAVLIATAHASVRRLVASIGLASSLLLAYVPAGATEITPFDPGTRVLGKTHGEWAEAWSQWVYSINTERNPILDETGQYCGVGQEGRVWFLAGSFFNKPVVRYNRHCTIPADKYIFLALFNGLSFPPDFPEEKDPCSDLPRKIDQIRCDVNRDVQPKLFEPLPTYWNPGLAQLRFEIDGRPLADPFAYRSQSGPGGFRFVVRPNSILDEFEFPVGPRSPAVADGFWVMLPPLPKGTHTLRTLARNDIGQQQDVTWTLKIE